LLKDTPFSELTQAIRLVDKGYTQLSPGLMSKMLVNPAPVSESLEPIERSELAELTPREREILSLIAQGANNREIAQTLFLSEKTVRNHVSNLLSRLGLRDRTQAAIYAQGWGGNVINSRPPQPEI
jgi:DNA-binding NarL/FixJ family response regulator